MVIPQTTRRSFEIVLDSLADLLNTLMEISHEELANEIRFTQVLRNRVAMGHVPPPLFLKVKKVPFFWAKLTCPSYRTKKSIS
jgi:hypothetical protein